MFLAQISTRLRGYDERIFLLWRNLHFDYFWFHPKIKRCCTLWYNRAQHTAYSKWVSAECSIYLVCFRQPDWIEDLLFFSSQKLDTIKINRIVINKVSFFSRHPPLCMFVYIYMRRRRLTIRIYGEHANCVEYCISCHRIVSLHWHGPVNLVTYWFDGWI